MRFNRSLVSGTILTAVLPLLLLATGCAYWGTNAPLNLLRYPAAEGGQSADLIVMLRGRGGDHKSFEQDGFIRDLRERLCPQDVVIPDSHLGYYMAETLVPRLKTDVIAPAKAAGYRRIWLVGVSMGGLGALMYLREHPEDIDGVYVIAPFLGYEDIIAEVAGAGGVAAWQPGSYDPGKDWERMFWDWLKTYANDPAAWAPIFLGYGAQDSFNPAHRLLGAILPPERIYAIQGGHDPRTMRKLWQLFLNDSALIEK
ncbi:MAG: alpha/beta fold hydrolase [Thermodesulfobacteriota bacterium]